MRQLTFIVCLCLSCSSQASECSGSSPELSVYFGNVELTRNGSVYRYYDVPETVDNNLISADSAGWHYNQAIRG
ncbi:KTSC domain-containing protein [uncultured Endozoicomonas sp.]|uniref:KTSC domain-containing protein n=1 Tax=uncultured Endozoicomonas sp. TaxID=432652 RepID=UPI00341D9485